MGFFTSSTKLPHTVDSGSAVVIKPSKWKRLLRKRKQSPSLRSALSAEFTRLSREDSVDDLRVLGNLQEIRLDNDFSDTASESAVSEGIVSYGRESGGMSSNASTIARRGSVETLSDTASLKRDLFSGRTVYMDALDLLDTEDGSELQRVDTLQSVYVDALSGEEKLQVKESVQITVMAEVEEGIPWFKQHLILRFTNY